MRHICCGSALRHDIARRTAWRVVPSRDCSPHVLVLNTASINATMVINSLLREQMQPCHDWRRLYQHRFWIVRCLFAANLFIACSFRQCVFCILRATVVVLLHGSALRVSSLCGVLTHHACGC